MLVYYGSLVLPFVKTIKKNVPPDVCSPPVVSTFSWALSTRTQVFINAVFSVRFVAHALTLFQVIENGCLGKRYSGNCECLHLDDNADTPRSPPNWFSSVSSVCRCELLVYVVILWSI